MVLGMMIWDFFSWHALVSILFWFFGAALVLLGRNKKIAEIFILTGLIVLGVFIVRLWFGLQRPPLRTMGETRLWFAFFLVSLGIFASFRWKYHWLMAVSCVLGCIFLIVDLAKPELYSKTLMPALQSYWFVPHVTVYVFSYALLGVSSLCSCNILYKSRKIGIDRYLLKVTDNIVYMGLGFLMLGLLSGAFWAKEAWGHYWSWDPKEVWAFITAAGYLTYIHLRLRNKAVFTAVCVLPCAFVLLMITWLGVSYLPAGSGSIHTY